MNDYLRTKEYFIDTIKAESAIRKIQLSYLKDILDRTEGNKYKLTFMKITVPELYAHYEGYFKFIFKEVIKHINNCQIENISLNRNHLIFPLLTELTSEVTKQKSKAKRIINLFKNIFENNEKIFEIFNADKYILNLDSTKQTLKILGINSYRLPMKNLDSLYNRRCEIAHGVISEDNPFYTSSDLDITDILVEKTYNDYWIKHYNTVIRTIDILSDLFISFISDERYKSA